jgi:GntR family transcriptional regulator
MAENAKKWNVDRNSVIPLYYQLKEFIKDQIQSGVYKINEVIPSERELSEQFEINRLTVRQAINELVNEGFLYRRRGIGTFVSAPKIEQPLTRLTNFSNDMLSRGIVPGARVVSMQVIQADQYIASKLQIDPGEEVLELVRLRTAEGEPMALEKSSLVYEHTKELFGMDMENKSLYQMIENVCGIRFVRALQTIEIGTIKAEEARLLGIDARDPVMKIERITYAENIERPVEFVRSHYRADRYKFIIEMKI